MHHIALAGDLGSGKSTAAVAIAQQYGLEHVYVGMIMRRMAEARGIDMEAMSKLAKQDPSIDGEIDSVYRDLGKRDEPLVIDSRMAWHFMPQAFKVYFMTDLAIAAARVYATKDRVREQYATFEAARDALKARRESEVERYRTMYGVSIDDLSNYDLVVETGSTTPQQVVDLVVDQARKHWTGKPHPRFWVSPRSIYPTKPLARRVTAVKETAAAMKAEGYGAREPIKVALYDGQLYLLDGHIRAAAALLAGLPLIPAEMPLSAEAALPEGGMAGEFAKKACTAALLAKWQTVLSFEFTVPPNHLRTVKEQATAPV